MLICIVNCHMSTPFLDDTFSITDLPTFHPSRESFGFV
ncbi:hypothetical protein L479_03088 [Exiguobacterium sp. S17]|nr:hypothetical protein L479_03088 [Exiguobacterium sp. S17]